MLVPYSWFQILWYFYIYGFLGWCSEVAFAAIAHGKFVNRGFVNGPICSIYGFGVMNLKDAPMVPNGMARNMAKKRTAKNGALVLADQDRILSTAWELGDCNNQFVLMIVSKEGELVFLRKGVLSEQDKADFYETIEKYK